MFDQIIEMARNWSAIYQFFFVIIIATLGTILATAITGGISEFLSNGLPKILYGYPPHDNKESIEEEE